MFIKRKNISGILLLDKPKFISSNNALQQIKFIFQAKKAGHSGSLDPLSSGMLPIFFGKATKFTKNLINANKYYHVVAKMGEKTSTGDISGSIIKKRKVFINIFKIEKVLRKFHGTINQVPPMYSAIKYNGIPLYKYARKGLCIPRNPRKLRIIQLIFIEYVSNLLELKIECSKGTYIRSLIEDIGDNLGCGAHVVFLRRLSVGPYKSNQLVKLSTLYKIMHKYINKKINYLYKIMHFLLPIRSLFV